MHKVYNNNNIQKQQKTTEQNVHTASLTTLSTTSSLLYTCTHDHSSLCRHCHAVNTFNQLLANQSCISSGKSCGPMIPGTLSCRRCFSICARCMAWSRSSRYRSPLSSPENSCHIIHLVLNNDNYSENSSNKKIVIPQFMRCHKMAPHKLRYKGC